jgi:hypothetical protein
MELVSVRIEESPQAEGSVHPVAGPEGRVR